MAEKYVLKDNKGNFLLRGEDGKHKTSKISYTTYTKEEAEDLFSKNEEYFKKLSFSITKESNAKKKLSKQTIKLDSGETVEKHKRIDFSKTVRAEVYNKSEGHCMLCGKFVPYTEFTVDHIKPLAKGGTNEMNNLQCACKRCNTIKQDIMPDELTEYLTMMLEI